MKTKIYFILLFFVISNACSQIYRNGFREIFTDRFAGAKAEAMGKILSVGNENYFSLFANPAIIRRDKEASVYYTYSDNFYLLNQANFNFLGASINCGSAGAFGVALLSYDMGKFYVTTPDMPDGFTQYEPYEKLYAFSYANSIGSLLNFGLEANLFIDGRAYNKSVKATFANAGISKQFVISDKPESKYNLTTGIHCVNIFGQGTEYDIETAYGVGSGKLTEYFPSILRLGIENEIIKFDKDFYSRSYLFRLLASIEYEDILNQKYGTSIKLGAELTLLNIFALRGGYFSTTLENINNTRANLKNFTYGMGLNFDFRELANKTPFALSLDYVSLSQPSYVNNIDEWGNFHTFNARVRYFFD